jgi:transcription elongation factor Elf1
MKVKLMVNWEERTILTVKELDERIDARVEEVMQDTDTYDEYLDDYLVTNYTRMELFDALADSDIEREEVLADIRSGVAEAIYDFVNMDISSDYSEVIVEV